MNDTCRIKKNQFWFEISCIDCILKACYEDMLDSSFKKPKDKLNLACSVTDILCRYGFMMYG